MGRNKLTPQEIELKKVVSQNLNDLLSKTTSKKIAPLIGCCKEKPLFKRTYLF